MQRTRRMRSRRKGFTLLEILIVVGIIALLAAFVVPNFIGAQKDTEQKMAKAAVDGNGPIATAVELFRVQIGRFPKELKELSEKPDNEEEAAKWKEPYIKDPSTLKDPWGEEYQYRFPGQFHGEENYDLWSKGPDKQDGTDDDITNWTKAK